MKWGWLAGGAVVCGSVAIGGGPARADVIYEEVLRGAGREVRRETTLRGDRRRIATSISAAGKKGAARSEVVEIMRLDRDTVWLLEPGTKTYRETSLGRVRELARVAAGEAAPATAQPLRALYQTGKPEIAVSSPQPGPKIAGFATERVKATMVVPLKNRKTGSSARGLFEQEVWLTRDARLVEEIRKFEEACTGKLGTAESLARIQTGAGPWMDALVPEMRALEARIRSLGGFGMKSSLSLVWEALPNGPRQRATRTNAGTMASEVTAVRFAEAPDLAFEVPEGYQPPGQPLVSTPAAPAGSASKPPAAGPGAPGSASLRPAAGPKAKRAGKSAAGRERLGSEFDTTLPDGAAVIFLPKSKHRVAKRWRKGR